MEIKYSDKGTLVPVRDGFAISQDFPFGFSGPGNLVSNFRNTIKIFLSVRNWPYPTGYGYELWSGTRYESRSKLEWGSLFVQRSKQTFDGWAGTEWKLKLQVIISLLQDSYCTRPEIILNLHSFYSRKELNPMNSKSIPDCHNYSSQIGLNVMDGNENSSLSESEPTLTWMEMSKILFASLCFKSIRSGNFY